MRVDRGRRGPMRAGLAAVGALLLSALWGCPSLSRHERAAEPPALRPDPPPAPAPPLTVLPSGPRVVTLQARDDVFAAALLVTASPADDPLGLEGLTRFTVDAALLATGADPDRQDRPERRALELGGRIEAICDGVVAGWRVAGPVAARGPLLRLLRDVATAPDFPATRVQALAEMLREEGEQVRSRTLADARGWALALALGEGRPLRLDPTEATLARVNREDVARHHARLFTPDRALVVTEGAPADVVAQALRDWSAAPGPPSPAAPRCPAPRVEQAWLAAPDQDAGLIVAVPVPGPTHPLRPALEGLLLASEAQGGGVRPVVELHDRGDRAVLLLIVRGAGPEVLDPVDAWLARVARFGGPGRALLGARLRRAAALVAADAPGDRLVVAARTVVGHLAPAADANADPDADLAAVQHILANNDHRVRVAMSPEGMLRRMEAWGPVRTLPRQGSLCPESATQDR